MRFEFLCMLAIVAAVSAQTTHHQRHHRHHRPPRPSRPKSDSDSNSNSNSNNPRTIDDVPVDVKNKWTWADSTTHFLINMYKSNVWTEISTVSGESKSIYNYTLEEDLVDGGVILWDKTRSVYAFVTGQGIYFNKNLDELKKGKFGFGSRFWTGNWVVRTIDSWSGRSDRDKKATTKKTITTTKKATTKKPTTQKPTTKKPTTRKPTATTVNPKNSRSDLDEKIAAKWVWRGLANAPEHSLVNYEGSDIWVESFLTPLKYIFKEFTNDGGVILNLVDDKAIVYVRLTDNEIMYSNSIEQLRMVPVKFVFSSPGSWAKKPNSDDSPRTIDDVAVDVINKWAWHDSTTHFLINMQNSNLWLEISTVSGQSKAIYNYTLVEDLGGKGVILWDESRKVYALVTDQVIYFNKNVDELRKENPNFIARSRGNWVKRTIDNGFDRSDSATTKKATTKKPTTKKPTTKKPTTTTVNPNKVTGKWVWKSGASHFFVNKGDSQLWEESKNNQVINDYIVIEWRNNGDLIIFDLVDKYVLITEKFIYIHDNLNKLKNGEFKSTIEGSWSVRPDNLNTITTTKKATTQKPTTKKPTTKKPTTKKPTTTPVNPSKVTGKWVWKSGASHYFINKGNNNLWEEVKNSKVINDYIVMEWRNNGDLILYDLIDKFVLITEKFIYIHDNLNKLKNGEFKSTIEGSWSVRPDNLNTITTPKTPATTKKATTNKPTTKKPTTLKPTTKKPTTKKPTTTKPKSTTPAIIPIDVTGKWVWHKNSKHYLVNKGNSDLWEEVNNNIVVKTYRVKEKWARLVGLILYDETNKQYARVVSHKIYFNKDLSDLKNGIFEKSAAGKWVVNPNDISKATTAKAAIATTTTNIAPTTKSIVILDVTTATAIKSTTGSSSRWDIDPSCPNRVECVANPCAGKKCQKYPKAECVADYCDGCNYYFRWKGHKILKSRC